jgi:hypothetical protein
MAKQRKTQVPVVPLEKCKCEFCGKEFEREYRLFRPGTFKARTCSQTHAYALAELENKYKGDRVKFTKGRAKRMKEWLNADPERRKRQNERAREYIKRTYVHKKDKTT